MKCRKAVREKHECQPIEKLWSHFFNTVITEANSYGTTITNHVPVLVSPWQVVLVL